MPKLDISHGQAVALAVAAIALTILAASVIGEAVRFIALFVCILASSVIARNLSAFVAERRATRSAVPIQDDHDTARPAGRTAGSRDEQQVPPERRERTLSDWVGGIAIMTGGGLGVLVSSEIETKLLIPTCSSESLICDVIELVTFIVPMSLGVTAGFILAIFCYTIVRGPEAERREIEKGVVLLQPVGLFAVNLAQKVLRALHRAR